MPGAKHCNKDSPTFYVYALTSADFVHAGKLDVNSKAERRVARWYTVFIPKFQFGYMLIFPRDRGFEYRQSARSLGFLPKYVHINAVISNLICSVCVST
jgi:hypothetical protein